RNREQPATCILLPSSLAEHRPQIPLLAIPILKPEVPQSLIFTLGIFIFCWAYIQYTNTAPKGHPQVQFFGQAQKS
ncbi:hypothetical protein KI387_008708, partial [Taxus chinensis]